MIVKFFYYHIYLFNREALADPCFKIVKYLIKSGSLNDKNQYGNIPLLLACECGNLEIVKYFIECCDCDINYKNDEGNTPLGYAYYLSHNNSKCLTVIEYLINNGADINSKNNDGQIPSEYIFLF